MIKTLAHFFSKISEFVRENWVIIASLVYLVSPIDLIPEILVGPLGLIDDFGIVITALILRAGQKFWKEYNQRRELASGRESRESIGEVRSD